MSFANFQRKYHEASATIFQRDSEIANLNEIIESKDQIIRNLQSSFEKLRKEVENESSKRSTREILKIKENNKNALVFQKSQIQRLERQKEKLEDEGRKLYELQDELKKEINELKEEQQRMRNKEQEDKNQIIQLKAELDEKTQEKIDLATGQLKSESKARRVLSFINQQLSDLNRKFDKQTDEIKELRGQMQELKMENQKERKVILW